MITFERLRSQFKTSLTLQAMFDALLRGHDDLKTPIEDIRTETDLDNAIGVQQDNNGVDLGVGRNAFSDADYKELQSIKILARNSGGHVDDVVEIVQRLAKLTTADPSPPSTIPTVSIEDFPAKFEIDVTTQIKPEFAALINALLLEARSPGIGARVKHSGDVDGTSRFKYNTVGQGYNNGKYSGIL